MHKLHPFTEVVKTYISGFNPVIPFNKNMDKLLLMDFTRRNTELTNEILKDTELFSEYINATLKKANARYGIGGYEEHRAIYERSELFGKPIPDPSRREEPSAAQTSLSDESDFEAITSLEEPEATYGYHWADPNYYGLLKDYALHHRSQPTKAEKVLWELVKAKKLGNYKFRRQHIIDKYIADIVCLDKRLIIEIDGLIHQLPENVQGDEIRTNALKEKGFYVIRFTNEEVLNQTQRTLEIIVEKLNDLPGIKEKSNLSSPFGGQGAEPRQLHLGIDIWGETDTPVYAPIEGIVHSFNFNNAFGDYGATIILQHKIEDFDFHTLYGHLSLKSIQNVREGETVEKGQWIGSFGEAEENGHWPPHLHFQIVIDMQGMKGDYPGVCAFADREKYLTNCPDPDLILRMMQYAE